MSKFDHRISWALERAAVQYADKEATVDIGTGERRTWSETRDRVSGVAAGLRDLGLDTGDRVGLLTLNSARHLELWFAIPEGGMVMNDLNYRLAVEELVFIANDSNIKVLFVDDTFLDAGRQVIERCDDMHTLVHMGPGTSPPDGTLAYDALAATPERTFPDIASGGDALAAIFYTGGTTGLPKGAMLTHGNIFWNSINVCFGEDTMTTTTLTCAPLFHIGGLNVTTLLSLAKGVEVVLLRSFEPGEVLRLIEEHKVGSMFGAPTMFLMMAQHENFEKTDLSTISTLICGGAPVPVPLIETYGKRDVSFCQGYGLTETAPFASLLSSDLAMVKVGSAGKAPMFTEVRIVDENNNSVAAGVHGEVCIKGPNVMKGYWNRPDATAEAIDELGWFHSGDIGYLDDEDFLYLCDRVKDMVITGGENVYPAEIESILYGHPAVLEVAVIGLPDEKWGEAVTAVAVLEDGATLDLEELRAYAGESLARYKLPSELRIIDMLPRNPAGKVQKFKLKEQFTP